MDASAVVVVGLMVAAIFGVLGAVIGEKRGRTAAGFALGALLGPLGCLAALFLPRDR